MIDHNPELIEFIKNFKEKPSSKLFEVTFKKYRRFFKLSQYNDPSGVLLNEDIESIAMMGFLKAIQKYDGSRWDNAIAWCYYIIRQQILREIKKNYKGDHTYINSHMNPDLEIENIAESIETSENISDYVDISNYYLPDIQEFCSLLEDINITASKLFQLKLAFPELSRNVIARILGFKRRNGLAKIVKQIRKLAFDNLNKELYDGRLSDPFAEFYSQLSDIKSSTRISDN